MDFALETARPRAVSAALLTVRGRTGSIGRLLERTRKRVAMMRVPATNVPRNVPETFDSPPVRRR